MGRDTGESSWTEVTTKHNRKKKVTALKMNSEFDMRRWQRQMRKEAVILVRPIGNTSYANMVRKIKIAMSDKDLKYDITSRRAKSGNMVLDVPYKEQADSLANLLKIELGETTGIRRSSPTVLLFLMGIEDSVEETELRSTLEAFDINLKEY